MVAGLLVCPSPLPGQPAAASSVHLIAPHLKAKACYGLRFAPCCSPAQYTTLVVPLIFLCVVPIQTHCTESSTDLVPPTATPGFSTQPPPQLPPSPPPLRRCQ